jgi:hypothetical protein
MRRRFSSRAAAAAVEIFYDYFIARTRFEGTLEYDNTKIVLFTAILLLSISFNSPKCAVVVPRAGFWVKLPLLARYLEDPGHPYARRRWRRARGVRVPAIAHLRPVGTAEAARAQRGPVAVITSAARSTLLVQRRGVVPRTPT